MKHTYTIPQKMSNSGTIHDIASDQFDREIVFAAGCEYAVVFASYYYGRKGYSTHKTQESAIAASQRNKSYSHKIIDRAGVECIVYGDRLVPHDTPARVLRPGFYAGKGGA